MLVFVWGLLFVLSCILLFVGLCFSLIVPPSFFVGRRLVVVCCLLVACCLLLFDVSCLSSVLRCWLFVVCGFCCLLQFVVCCMLCVSVVVFWSLAVVVRL